MRAARATERGRRSGIAALCALWPALASTGDHLLAVNASPARLGRRPGNRGRGEIKERVRLGVGTGGRGGGWAQFGRLYPGTGQAGWRGMSTTEGDRTLLLTAPRPLLRATPTRSGWRLQKPKAQGPFIATHLLGVQIRPTTTSSSTCLPEAVETLSCPRRSLLQAS